MSIAFLMAGGGGMPFLSSIDKKEEPVEITFHGGDDDSGDVFVVETKLKAGNWLGSHVHEHGHLSVLVSGTADVTIAEETKRMTGYCMVSVPAGQSHKVEAVTDVIWLCLSSVENDQQNKWAEQFRKEVA